MSRRVVVCTGPLNWDHYSIVHDALGDLKPGDIVITGDAPGLDRIAISVAHLYRCPTIHVPYIGWLRGAGGPVRNGLMITAAAGLSDDVEVRAFGSRGDDAGTDDCVNQAQAARIPVTWYAKPVWPEHIREPRTHS